MVKSPNRSNFMLKDRFGRQITYMRISITDRCNLRCVYCMPEEGVPWRPHQSMLTYEEIATVARAAASEGVRSFRLTGGEPLVRKGLPALIRMLAAIPGVEDISLTTNAILLEKQADLLAEAGLNRINISLDTLQEDRFQRITRGGLLEQLWKGVEAAEKAGLAPLKFNTVVLRGVNDDEIADIARLSYQHPWHMRFIELMPVKNQIPWGAGFPLPAQAYFSCDEIRTVLAPLGLEPMQVDVGSGPAREYRLKGAVGTVGIISPIGEHFCAACNRLRLTADGNLRVCLLSDLEIPILNALRSGEAIEPYLYKAVGMKPEKHELLNDQPPEERSMSEVGG
jgi:GTP 3',8-cyclase